MPAYRFHPHVAQREDQAAMEQYGFSDGDWMADAPTLQYDGSASSTRPANRSGYSTMPIFVQHDRRRSHGSLSQKKHIYHSEGYFDSAREPRYYYEDPWAMQQPEGSSIGPPRMAPLLTSSTPARTLFHAIPYQHAATTWETYAPLYPDNRSLGYINGNSQIPPCSVSPTNRMRSYSYVSSPSIPASHGMTTHAIGLPDPAAHQPISPAQQSTYSELSVHIQFMDKLKREQEALKNQTPPPTLRTPEASDVSIPPVAPTAQASPDEVPQKQSPKPAATSSANGQRPAPKLTMPAKVKLIAPQPQSANLKPPATSAASSSKSSKAPSRSTTTEQKKTILPCNFCKERKIACGRPPEGSADPTCNQCLLRSFKCVYPKERIPRRSRARK
ncbi:hypothetical protein HYPSUDRAFT_67846 [Hypholoma sublateritium FD-334 SS-4]|uniref:Zn(2)-C6 fungal-type domain-containing protein n=1 Tax=Hypholoma sublateritium (strain FD-334 SS-4) TaxID=945553 RepID=A0A0D2NRD2_HYPSF|nr:hypothetical protein HYPSUDRAFT_67846 [Hypholoma sublateritium FD-334 SS-4]